MSEKATRQQTPAIATSRRRGGGGGGTGGPAAGADLALQQAMAGDLDMLRDLADTNPQFASVLHTVISSRSTDMIFSNAGGGDAIWGDVMTSASTIEETRTQLPGAQPVAESLVEGSLPDAVEINDTGPVERWSGVQSDIESSEGAIDNDRCAELLAPELGQDVSGFEVHIDRSAWRVAATYNADAVILNGSVFVHRRVEEAISSDLYGPVAGADLVQRTGGLIHLDWKPPFAKHSDSEVVMTDGNYTIEMKGHETIIYDQSGNQITRIWGDPHVNEGGGGDNWHFGDDSTFILPDGTKLCLDTKETKPGVFYTVGVDVLSGSDRFHYGVGGETGITKDAVEWDEAHADRSDAAHAGIFALQSNNQWAKQDDDGNFYDIKDESWKGYLADKDVDVDRQKAAVGLTEAQLAVAGDKDIKDARAGQNGNGGTSTQRHEDSAKTNVWFAAQEVEVNRETGQVVNPRRYMPLAVEINPRGEPNYIPGIEREMTRSVSHEMGAQIAGLIQPRVGVDFAFHNVHIDPEAWKVAHTYNCDAVIWNREVFIAQDIAEQAEDELAMLPPPGQAQEAGPERQGFLTEPKWHPPFCKHTDSKVVMTGGGNTIEMKGHEVIVYDRKGKQITRIWGDPHVNEKEGGDNWHFGNDSTFILPDGTKLCLDTKEIKPGIFVTVGVDVLAGSERYHYGEGDDAGMTRDAIAWDREHADKAEDDGSAGVFALQSNGEWAIMANDGQFYDITDESWQDYLKDKDVDFDPNKLAEGLTEEQIAVADDRDLAIKEAAREGGWGTGRPTTRGGRRYHRFDRLHIEAEVMALLMQDDLIERKRS
jgi:hypothetical protein